MKLNIKFPHVKAFDDYHEIFVWQDTLNEIFHDFIKAKEVDCDGVYWGLFYTGKMPSKEVIQKLLEKKQA